MRVSTKHQRSRRSGARRHQNKARYRTIGIACALISLLLCAVMCAVVVLENPHTMPFRQITIHVDADHVKMTELQQVVATHLAGGFFSLRVRSLQHALLAMPWVAKVALRRVWPDQLIIDITEQRPIARWNHQLINKQGELFTPSAMTIPTGLPVLTGPMGSVARVLRQYHDFAVALATIGVTLNALDLNDRGAWRMTVNDRITVMLGHEDVERRLQRFITWYPKIIKPRTQQITTVDLRYPDGIAVK